MPTHVDVERRIKATLGMAASLQHKADGSGRLVISYRSLDQIDEVLRRLGIKP
jgi:hypothetical protein